MIEPLLPVFGAKGRPQADDRRVINGMLFKAKNRVAWWNVNDTIMFIQVLAGVASRRNEIEFRWVDL